MTALLAIFGAACSGKATTTSSTGGDAGDSGPFYPRPPGACPPGAGPPLAGARVPLQHRPTPACCPSQRGPAPSGQPYPTCPAAPGSVCPSDSATTCSSDSECTSGVNGRCFPFEGLVGPGGCSYDECFTDSDCGSEATCLCRRSSTDNSANVCVRGGNCVVDSDCGDGGYCSPSVEQSCLFPSPYFCHTANDTCTDDSDCPSVDAGPFSCSVLTPCAYDPGEQRWACTQLTCCPP